MAAEGFQTTSVDFENDYRLLIDGRMVAGAATLAVINPANGQPFAHAPAAGPAELEAAVAAARAAFPAWRATPIEDRRARLKTAADLIDAHAEALARLFTREQGRPVDAAKGEILQAAFWMRATADLNLPVDITEDTDKRRIEVRHEPLGVVCGIVPWNFPVTLAVWKIAPALLAGNTLVLKPSPYTPLCTLKLGELLAEVFPPGVLNVICGDDALGPLMTAHPGFAKISFTGSTATGRKVMETAARDLKRLTLELGGNDAAIIMPDVDVDAIAQQIFFGAFFNTAQICVATKRLFIHEDIYEAVRDRLHALAKQIVVGDGAEQGSILGPIQNAVQHRRVLDLIDDARASGLVLLQGAAVPERGYFVPITLVDNPPDNARVVTEEAFGPVLPLLSFKTVDEVVARANDTEYGLAGAV